MRSHIFDLAIMKHAQNICPYDLMDKFETGLFRLKNNVICSGQRSKISGRSYEHSRSHFYIQSMSYGLLFPFNEVGVSLLVSVGWSVCRTRGIMIPLLYFEIIRSKVSLNGPPPWKQFTINILRKADSRTLDLYGMVGLDEKMTPIIFGSLCQRSSSQGLHLFFWSLISYIWTYKLRDWYKVDRAYWVEDEDPNGFEFTGS